MSIARLEAGLAAGLVAPDVPTLLVGVSAPPEVDLFDTATVVTPFAPDHAQLVQAGIPALAAIVEAPEPVAQAVVRISRARARAEAWIAAATGKLAPEGRLVVDGAKTDGIDPLWRACRVRLTLDGTVTKAHGRLFAARPGPEAFADWAGRAPPRLVEGYRTAPGAFSADGVDPGSAQLAEALPAGLGGRFADLGAGWGYLSARLLERADGPLMVDLVEADHDALAAARVNLAGSPVVFHWDDACTWQPAAPLDGVIMNPPFHVGRRADPALGARFIEAAAGMLAPAGRLWLVANRHLPYERDLERHFAEWRQLGGADGFKLLTASRPLARRKGAGR